MARPNTFKIDPIEGYLSEYKMCAICGDKSKYRAWFYPTYMNGDAVWCGDYCEEHRKINLRDVLNGKIKTKYKIYKIEN